MIGLRKCRRLEFEIGPSEQFFFVFQAENKIENQLISCNISMVGVFRVKACSGEIIEERNDGSRIGVQLEKRFLKSLSHVLFMESIVLDIIA